MNYFNMENDRIRRFQEILQKTERNSNDFHFIEIALGKYFPNIFEIIKLDLQENNLNTVENIKYKLFLIKNK